MQIKMHRSTDGQALTQLWFRQRLFFSWQEFDLWTGRRNNFTSTLLFATAKWNFCQIKCHWTDSWQLIVEELLIVKKNSSKCFKKIKFHSEEYSVDVVSLKSQVITEKLPSGHAQHCARTVLVLMSQFSILYAYFVQGLLYFNVTKQFKTSHF